MKKLLTTIILLITTVFAQHAFAATGITATTSQTATSFTVNYHYVGTPTQTTKLYSWLTNTVTGAWVDRSNLLLTINSSTTEVTKDFSVTYDFTALGLTGNGTKYAYYLADGTTDSANLWYGAANFVVGVAAVPSGSENVALVATGQYPGQSSGQYQETFNVTPNTSRTATKDVTLNIYNSATQGAPEQVPVTLPVGGNAVSPSVDDLTPGSYTASVYDGATKLSSTISFTISNSSAQSGTPACAPGPFTQSSSNVDLCTVGTATNISNSTSHWTWSCTVPSVNPVSCSAQVNVTPATQTLSGVSISFPNGKTITNTSVDIPILVSVDHQLSVNLSVYMAPVGTVLNAGNPLLVQVITPTTPVNTKIHFDGLTTGQNYYFSIKNNTTGIYSDPIQFTTSGGTNTQTGNVLPIIVNGGTGNPGGFQAPTDTISDSGIVPKCGRTGTKDDPSGTQMCTFKDFMKLVANIISFGVTLFFIAFTVVLLYSGSVMVLLGRIPDKNTEQKKRWDNAKDTIFRMVKGLVIVILAWTIISTVLTALGVQHQYILLDIFSGH